MISSPPPADRAVIPGPVGDLLRMGTVLPAHPLALTNDEKIDTRFQRALTRYYVDAGAGGVAVGVHTTQFAIRERGLYEDVLALAAAAAADWTSRPFALVAGVTGKTEQAVAEAKVARDLGYHAALLNLAAWRESPESAILEHCHRVADELPLIGFALLPEVGGFHLSYDFWRQFAEIERVVAMKMAPFNRYRTLDIGRAIVDARAEERITLYTGNDDHILLDLLVPMRFPRDGEQVSLRVRGGLLGQWSIWTERAVALHERVRAIPDGTPVDVDLLSLDSMITDANGAVYDALNDFAGCIPGCLEVLRRQGLVRGVNCLNPEDRFGEYQLREIDRVIAAYPELIDDDFVAANVERWLS